jgi:hypothetical protein
MGARGELFVIKDERVFFFNKQPTTNNSSADGRTLPSLEGMGFRSLSVRKVGKVEKKFLLHLPHLPKKEVNV